MADSSGRGQADRPGDRPGDREGDRDRRDDGRPEQARPRDRTGRPLPYDTSGVALTEDHEPASVEEALALGVELWGEQRFFEAHECLEHVWHAAPEDDRDLWQGVIQLAVAAVHVQRDNPGGAVALLRRALERLDRYPPEHRGIDVDAARAYGRAAMDHLDAGGGVATFRFPTFPATATGAWFTPDATALLPPRHPTPIPEGPAWLDAARPRQPRRRDDA